MQVNIRSGYAGEDQRFHQTEEARRTEDDVALRGNAGNHFRKSQSNGQGWNYEDKARNRSRNPHVEELTLVVDGRAYTDERTERSDERRRRKEVRQAGIDLVVAARHIVPHLVRH